MKQIFLFVYVLVDYCACLTNLTTHIYILKTFNIKTHVFTLVFLDSLISSVCSFLSAILDTLFLVDIIKPSHVLCYLTFLTSFLPNCLGAVFTLLVTSLRYILAKKAAKNIKPSNKKVRTIALGIFVPILSAVLATCLLHAIFNMQLSLFIDVCSEQVPQPRIFGTVIFLNFPNICNILALITDIQMIKFLKKVMFTTQNKNSQNLQLSGNPSILEYMSRKVKPYLTLG